MATDLENAFEQALRRDAEVARTQLKQNSSRFLQMIGEHGGVGAARRLLASPSYQESLTRLWEIDPERLNLSIEAEVLKPEFASLFTDQERAIARQRLAEFGYRAPW